MLFTGEIDCMSLGLRFRLWVSGNRVDDDGELSEKLVEIRMVSDRMMAVLLVLVEDVLRLICGYALLGGRSLVEKQSSYDEVKGMCDMYSDFVMCLGDINGHVSRHIDRFDRAHWGAWWRSEEFGRKNVTRVFPGETFMCVKYKKVGR